MKRCAWRVHRLADELVKGIYWANGKGCAIGCLAETGIAPHKALEDQISVPRTILFLVDRIFEGMSNERSMEWPEAFILAIKPGANLAHVIDQFMVWMLANEEAGVVRFAHEDGKQAIAQVVALYQRRLAGETVEASAWLEARRVARSAAADADAYAAAYAAAADAAAAAYAYADAARKKHFAAMRDMLLKLLQDAPVAEESNA